jgi:hypothetical protein
VEARDHVRVGENLSRKGTVMEKPRHRFKDYTGLIRATESGGDVSFRGLDDEFAKLDALRTGLKLGAVCHHHSPQRHLAPLYNRASERLVPVCQLLVPWRAGMRMRKVLLEDAICNWLESLDILTRQVGRPVAEQQRKTVERVLADLRRRRKAK